MEQGKTILVLGGGTGGIVAASRLRKKLPGESLITYFSPLSYGS